MAFEQVVICLSENMPLSCRRQKLLCESSDSSCNQSLISLISQSFQANDFTNIQQVVSAAGLYWYLFEWGGLQKTLAQEVSKEGWSIVHAHLLVVEGQAKQKTSPAVMPGCNCPSSTCLPHNLFTTWLAFFIYSLLDTMSLSILLDTISCSILHEAVL